MNVRRKRRIRIPLLLLTTVWMILFFLTCTVKNVYGKQTSGENDGVGRYEVVVDDAADLLSEEEKKLLAEDMAPISVYGNVAFHSVNEHTGSTEAYAEKSYRSLFGKKSGTLFLVDMDKRQIYIFSDGDMYRTITSAKANTITDNVYRMATNRKYYSCAKSVFEQILRLLEGKTIAEPMKYISNAILSLIIGMLASFLIISKVTKTKRASYSDLVGAAVKADVRAMRPNIFFLNETKKFSPPSGDGGSSGGGGGGGSSGGGGGHGF